MARGKKKTSKASKKKSTASAPEDTATIPWQDGDYGKWDPRLTNCHHYIKRHRDSAEERPDCGTWPAQYDSIHTSHMIRYHPDRDHPGFCTEVVTEEELDSQEEADYDLDHSDAEHEHEHEHEHDYEQNEEGEEVFSMDLPTIPFISHTEKRHKILLKLLGLHEDEQVSRLFTTISTITDPMTQPTESDSQVLSLDLVSQLIIALCYDQTSIIADYELSQRLFLIVDGSLKLLNCHDEVKIRSLNNSDLKVDWKPRMHEWTPHGLNDQDLRLLYMINCVCIYTIYKLYLFNEPDLCLNPFLGYFIKLWKIFTNVVLLGLEVDRRTEPTPTDTPNVIKQVIRGSSAIRYVLASILNDDLENRYHDFHHLNIFNFLSPYGRRNGSGALYADVRWYVGAMLALGSELNEVVETLVDLEPNDRYDEDVKYIFSYEYEDFHHQSLFPEDYEDGEPKEDVIIYEDQDGILHKVVHQRCTCQFFDDDEELEEEEDMSQRQPLEDEDEDGDFSEIPTAVRSDQQIEFDEMGRDWRDVPREGNIFFNPQFTIRDDQCFSWPELTKIFDDMAQAPISEDVSKRVVMTIAKAVKFDFEQNINNSVTDNQEEIPESTVTPDKVYQKWSHEWTFEAMLALNPVASYAMLDEMFMAHGYRRVLIWFVTHMALSFTLMNYVFELVNELRGEARISKAYPFSRQGPLAISEVEKSMLLHEFLNNCLIFLSKTHENYRLKGDFEAQNVSEFEKCIKIVKLICLMMNKLIENGSIDLEEYKVELTSILINWIGLIEEARELFFKINHNEDPSTLDALEAEAMSTSMTTGPMTTTAPTTAASSASHAPLPLRHKKFNTELKVSLGNVIKKMDNGTLLFRPFFELINYDNGSTNKDENSASQTSQSIKEMAEVPSASEAPHYIKGELKPLRRDEFYEHELVEQAMEE